jgi:hypothetical protein
MQPWGTSERTVDTSTACSTRVPSRCYVLVLASKMGVLAGIPSYTHTFLVIFSTVGSFFFQNLHVVDE